MPTAAVVAGPEPEMAPKNRQAMTVAAEMPPVKGPARLSATLMRRREMPAASISAPARMKAGSAISGNEPTEVKAIWTNFSGLSPSTMKEIIDATPSATVIGAPISKSTRKEPKRTETISVSTGSAPQPTSPEGWVLPSSMARRTSSRSTLSGSRGSTPLTRRR